MTYENLIIKPVDPGEVKHHNMSEIQALGASLKFLDNSLYKGADVRIIVRKLDGKVSNPKKYMEAHTHDVPQIYMLIGEPSELRFEIHLANETHNVESPCTIFIPPGVPHYERYLGGEGYLVTILKKGTYP